MTDAIPLGTRDRIIAAAAELFANANETDITVTDIARKAGITSQAVYRHFRGRADLYRAAVEHEIDALQTRVLSRVTKDPLPFLTASFWRVYAELAPQAHLVSRAVLTGRHDLTELFLAARTSMEIAQKARSELAFGQAEGLLRDDIDIAAMAESLHTVGMRMLVPLVFNGRFLSAEWLTVERILTASLFYPLTDLSNDGERKRLEARFEDLAVKLASIS